MVLVMSERPEPSERPLVRVGLLPLEGYLNPCALTPGYQKRASCDPGLAVFILDLLEAFMRPYYRFEKVLLATPVNDSTASRFEIFRSALSSGDADLIPELSIYTNTRAKQVRFSSLIEQESRTFFINPAAMSRSEVLLNVFGLHPYVPSLFGSIVLISSWTAALSQIEALQGQNCFAAGFIMGLQFLLQAYGAVFSTNLQAIDTPPFRGFYSMMRKLDSGAMRMISPSSEFSFLNELSQDAPLEHTRPEEIRFHQRLKTDPPLFCATIPECFDRMSQNKRLVMPMVLTTYLLQPKKVRGRVIPIHDEESFVIIGSAFVLPKKPRLRHFERSINRGISWLRGTGIVGRRLDRVANRGRSLSLASWQPLSLRKTSLLWQAAGGFALLSLLGFVAEWLVIAVGTLSIRRRTGFL